MNPSYVQTAIEIVLRSGRIQLAGFGDDLKINKKGTIDLVTQVDLDVETMCRKVIGKRYPSHIVLAEEFQNVPETATGYGHIWIFDPLDGTVNFAHGLPIFCSSLALEVDGHVEVGAVFDPNRQELFVAERGRGAWLNGRPLAVSSTTGFINAMLCTGFPYDVHAESDELVGLFGAFVRQAQAVRRLGSAALDLCYVAAGRLDGFWEQGLHPWDTAAGALVVEEAGGLVTDIQGLSFACRTGDILASNGLLHDDMVGVVQGFSSRNSRNRTE